MSAQFYSKRDVLQKVPFLLILPTIILLSFFCTQEQSTLRRDNPLDGDGSNWNPPAVSMISHDTAMSINDSIVLAATASGKNGLAEYIWAKDGSTFSDTTKTGSFLVTYPDSGRHLVRVKTADRYGLLSPADTCAICVTLDPPMVKMAVRDTTVSINDSVMLAAAGAGRHGVAKYVWAKDGSTFTDTTTTASVLVEYSDTGKHLVLVKSIDKYGLLSVADTCTVRVTLDPPTVKMAVRDTTISLNDSVRLSATGVGRHGVVKYLWAKNGSTFSDTTTTGSVLVVYSDTGKHLVLVNAIDKYGLLSMPDTCLVRVRHGPPILTHVHDTTVSQTTTITINVSAVDTNKNSRIQKYYWDIGANGWDDSTDVPTHNFSSPTGGSVKMVWAARDDNGFMTSDTFIIRYNHPPVIVSVTEPTAVTAWTQFDDRFYYGTGKGTLPLAFLATDADLPNETLTFWVSVKSSADTVSQVSSGTSSGSSAMVTQYVLFSAGINVTVCWKILVRDIFGDSAVSTGTFVAPPVPVPLGMKLITGGTFQMGSNDTVDYGAQPPHQVTFSSFYMDSTDVKRSDYLGVFGVDPSNINYGDDQSAPVERVTWFDAVLYCNVRSKIQGLDTTYSYTSVTGAPGNGCTSLGGLIIDTSKCGYRLPTEAEWEYACRGGTTTEYFWGNDTTNSFCSQYAWYGGTEEHGVAEKYPNPFGLYDIVGDVWQWCNDWYGVYPAGSQTNPQGASTGTGRVIRGGAFNTFNFQDELRCAYRRFCSPDLKNSNCGFRCVLRH
jgi:formylglycine-generating enzyme required for sulfatase activity